MRCIKHLNTENDQLYILLEFLSVNTVATISFSHSYTHTYSNPICILAFCTVNLIIPLAHTHKTLFVDRKVKATRKSMYVYMLVCVCMCMCVRNTFIYTFFFCEAKESLLLSVIFLRPREHYNLRGPRNGQKKRREQAENCITNRLSRFLCAVCSKVLRNARGLASIKLRNFLFFTFKGRFYDLSKITGFSYQFFLRPNLTHSGSVLLINLDKFFFSVPQGPRGGQNVTTVNYIVLQQIIFHGYFLHVSPICIFPVFTRSSKP